MTGTRPPSAADVRDGVAAIAETYSQDETSSTIAVVDGWGSLVRVDGGRLVVADGLGEHRRERRWDRATCRLQRLIILAHSGHLSIDALRWCRQVGVIVVVVDEGDGRPLFASVPGKGGDARLLRAQAVAGMSDDHPVGVGIVNHLLTFKLAGQERVARDRLYRIDVADTIESLAATIDDATTISELRQIEASAAAAYFAGWVDNDATAMRFAPRDRKRIPSHWQRFDGRRSLLGSGTSNRRAERPLNALLSYVYALCEVEAIRACHLVGLDPGMGLLHLDTKTRASMALDIVESARPIAENFALDMLDVRVFAKRDFAEQADGHVRLLAPLNHQMAEVTPMLREVIAPVAELVAHCLGQLVATDYKPTAPLTGANRKAAQRGVRTRKATSEAARLRVTAARERPVQPHLDMYTCPSCGTPVANPRHIRCDRCIEADPRQTSALRKSRGAAISARKQQEGAWADVRIDPDAWFRIIRPALASVGLSVIMRELNVSKSTAWSWKTGRTSPHMSHWSSLAALADVEIQPVDSKTGELSD